MRYLKMLGIATIAVASLAACAASTSANPLTSPEGTAYTSTLKAESEGVVKFEGAFPSVAECTSAVLEGKVETHSPTSAEGSLSSLTFSGCNYAVTVIKPGSLKIHGGESNRGILTSTGAEIGVATSIGTCGFTTFSTYVGTITDSSTTKGNATLDVNSALPRTGGSFLCGSAGTWTGSYKITTPSTLYVDSSVSASPLTSPEGTSYTSTIKAESEGVVKFDGSFSTVECSKSAFESKVEAHDPASTEGKVSSLSFGECNYPVEVILPGLLKIHAGEPNSGTVTWGGNGAQIRIKSSVGDCIYAIVGTDFGAITDSGITKGNATLDLSSAKLTKLIGNVSCAATATWTGSYKITTPSTLYID